MGPFGDILSATVYTGRTAAQVCLLGISLFVILCRDTDRGDACAGAGHVFHRAAALQDVKLKSLQFPFLQNVRPTVYVTARSLLVD